MTQSEINQIIQELIEASELSSAFDCLDAYLRKSNAENEILHNLILLKSRNLQNDKDFKLNNTVTKEVFDAERNKIILALLTLITEIPASSHVNKEELAELLKQNKLKQKKIGKILYSVPDEMQVEKFFTCIVRIGTESIDMDLFMEDIAETNLTRIDQLPRISDVMKVKLCEMGTHNFDIIPLNSQEEQLILPDEYTEWQFRVKPLQAGEHTLFLQVSVVEIIPNYGERRKDIKVLEKTISVITSQVIEKQPIFQASNNDFVPSNTQENDNQAIENTDTPTTTKSGSKVNILKPIGLFAILAGFSVGTWAAAASLAVGMFFGTYYFKKNLDKKEVKDNIIKLKNAPKETRRKVRYNSSIEANRIAKLNSLRLANLRKADYLDSMKLVNSRRLSQINTLKYVKKNYEAPKTIKIIKNTKSIAKSSVKVLQKDSIQKPKQSKVMLAKTTIPPQLPNLKEIDTLAQVLQAKVTNFDKILNGLCYPPALKTLGIEGEVISSIYVDEKGKYIKHTIVSSSNPLFTASVEKEIKKIKFTPAMKNGKAVKSWVNVPFKFSVKNNFFKKAKAFLKKL